MRPIGFSTGALARGDYSRALTTLRAAGVTAVELSALRLPELYTLVADLPTLDLSAFSFVSFHAPSRFLPSEESGVMRCLEAVVRRNIGVVVHPDTICDDSRWAALGPLLWIENMDKRKPTGRSDPELEAIFRRFPDAGLCFDIGHARQVDPTRLTQP